MTNLRTQDRIGSLVVHSLMLAWPMDVADVVDQQIEILWEMIDRSGDWAGQMHQHCRDVFQLCNEYYSDSQCPALTCILEEAIWGTLF